MLLGSQDKLSSVRALIASALLTLVAACAPEKPPEPQNAIKENAPALETLAPPPQRRFPLSTLPKKNITIKRHTLRVYVADTEGTLREGLMFVTHSDLRRDEGMIFIFPDIAYRSFWMKNTLIPLDIAYLKSDGTIINILTMKPLDESSYPSDEPARYAVETHAGWFESHHAKSGDRFDLRGLLKSR